MTLNLTVPLDSTKECTCDWQAIEDEVSAKASLRGTVAILGFELTDGELDLDRVELLAISIIKGVERNRDFKRYD